MSDVIADLQRRLANIIRRGKISAVRPGKQPLCRVQTGGNETDWLPVAQQHTGKHLRTWHPFAIGDPVIILSECGELRNGTVYPAGNTAALAAPADEEDATTSEYGDGAVFRYNPSTQEYEIALPAGGRVRITADVAIDGEVTLSKSLKVTQDVRAAQVYDQSGSMQAIRLRYNGHTHRYNNGTTEVPGSLFNGG